MTKVGHNAGDSDGKSQKQCLTNQSTGSNNSNNAVDAQETSKWWQQYSLVAMVEVLAE